jgi:hypothetical protein
MLESESKMSGSSGDFCIAISFSPKKEIYRLGYAGPIMNGNGRILMELSNLSRQNDELTTANGADLVVRRDLDLQLKEYKGKYEQDKSEFSVKGAPIPIFFAHLTYV